MKHLCKTGAPIGMKWMGGTRQEESRTEGTQTIIEREKDTARVVMRTEFSMNQRGKLSVFFFGIFFSHPSL